MRTFTLTEYPDMKYINFITHPDIYPDQKNRLLNYIQIAKDKKCVEVEYTKEQYGRYFVHSNFISSINMWNKIRSTLFGESDLDIDIVNCHPEIFAGLLTAKGLETECIKLYCKNRDEIINGIYVSEQSISEYNSFNKDNKTKKDIVKSLFTIIIYGGNIRTWSEQFNLKESDYKLTSFVKRFIAELNENIHNFVKMSEFKSLYNYAKEKQLVSAKTKYAKKFRDNLFNVNHFKILSLILQEYESKVIMSAIEYIKKQNLIVTSYNYDGFQISKTNDSETVINNLNEYIAKLYPTMNLIFINKPFKPGLNPEEFAILNSDRYERDIINKTTIYTVQKEYFEKFHFKIINPYCFIREDDTGITFIKPTSLTGIFADIYTDPVNPKDNCKTFIPYWVKDTTMRYYDSVNYYPVDSNCPSYVYNLWRPFPILKVLPNKADTSFIYKFINNIIGEPGVANYVLNWFAHVLQFPSRKTEVCLIFFGKQGCGKSSVAEHLLKLIIGDDKMIITSKVDKVFGRFTNTQGKLLAVLNETSGKETFNISEILKDAITCQQTEQEKKGIDSISIIDYTNYIFTTNNINSVKIPKDDRRYMPIEFNNTYLNDGEFFDELYSQLQNPIIMRAFYDDLMKRDISKFRLSVDRVETTLMQDMKFMNADPIEQFIDYWGGNLKTHMEVKMQSSDLYQKFRHFWEVEEGKKITDVPSQTKFSIRLKQFTARVKCFKQGSIYFELIN